MTSTTTWSNILSNNTNQNWHSLNIIFSLPCFVTKLIFFLTEIVYGTELMGNSLTRESRNILWIESITNIKWISREPTSKSRNSRKKNLKYLKKTQFSEKVFWIMWRVLKGEKMITVLRSNRKQISFIWNKTKLRTTSIPNRTMQCNNLFVIYHLHKIPIQIISNESALAEDHPHGWFGDIRSLGKQPSFR